MRIYGSRRRRYMRASYKRGIEREGFMRKAVSLMLLFIMVISASCLASCSEKTPLCDDTELFDITLNKYSLDEIKALKNTVVMENGDVTYGGDIWSAFVTDTENKTPAKIRYAEYYTLGAPESYDPDYYREIKDSYPRMYVHELSFDGESFTDVYYEGNKRTESSFKYMKRFEGEPSSSSAVFSFYTYYVLCDDEATTWKDCEKSMYSSNTKDWIRFMKVYSDIVLKGEKD